MSLLTQFSFYAVMLFQSSAPEQFMPLGKVLGGISLGVAALMFIGSAVFGGEFEAKAKKAIWSVIAGLVLLGISGLMVDTF